MAPLSERSLEEIMAIGALLVVIIGLLGFVFYQRMSLDARSQEIQGLISQCIESIETAKQPKLP